MSEEWRDDNARLMAGETLEPFDGLVEWRPEEDTPPEEGDMPPEPPDEVYDGGGGGGSERILIMLSARADHNVTCTLEALQQHSELFVQGATLVRVLKTPRGRIIHRLTPEALPPLMSAVADFVRLARGAGGEVEHRRVEPPLPLARQILAGGAFPGFRQLDGIVSSPVLRPDGSLHTKRGYDAATRLYLEPVGQFPAPVEAPTQQHAREAAERLLAPFAEFGFVHAADKAALIALILSLIGKAAHDGPTPMFPITANIRGAGKGKLASCAVLIATGAVPAVVGWPDTEAEQSKRLDTIVLDGAPVALFDNITGELGGGPLDLALTAWSYSGRVLGKSLMPRVERVWTIFIATGNNCTFGGDTARRVVPIRLKCDNSRPEERTFDIPDLQAHVQEHRAALYADAVTILRAFILAKKPAHGQALLGSFEGWDALVRAAIIWAGLPDPLDTRAEIEKVDEAAARHAQLVALLDALFHSRTEPWTSGDVARALEDLPESSSVGALTSREARDVFDGLGVWDRAANRLNNKAFGQELRGYADRPNADQKRIVRKGENRRKVALWKIE